MTSPTPREGTGPSAGSAPYGSWLRRLDSRPDAGSRLICFPHAGGSASVYRSWLPGWDDDAPELWAVQYPGREDRTDEPMPDSLPQLAQQIALALQWLADKPYTLFGHSMGAVVAYETARRAGRLGLRSPTRLIASGSPPPDSAAERADGVDTGPEVRWLQESEEAPDEELRKAAEHTLEGDIALLTSYTQTPETLPAPITVLRNEDDPDISTITDWERFTASEMQHITLPGDHFACYGQAEKILAALRDTSH
ncbi:thioesterase II family protein [Streptomyces sp. NPDC088348]|uniref:thioesterase II family protein n=1 Tax=Streptomyces sp. NPDC088348 TaxID=3365853 RepID=UPI00382DE7A6